MRNISANGLAKLANRYGNEPICIVEIDWYTDANGNPSTLTYADRDLPGPPAIPGKIVGLGSLDEVVDIVLGNGSSAQLELTLDDTDGSIKSLYDQYDFHKQDVRVYQWFNGLAMADRFLIFAGKINTPVTWNERDRTMKITVLSHLEDQEVGFSPEQGQFSWLPSAMCGKAWPMIFGTTQDCPATQITRVCQAVTITPVGIPSGSDAALAAPLYANGATKDVKTYQNMFINNVKIDMLLSASMCWADWEGEQGISSFNGYDSSTYDPANPCASKKLQSAVLLDEANKLIMKNRQQAAKVAAKEECITLSRHDAADYCATNGVGDNPIQTLGGEDFPQNTPIWVNIGGGSFYGYFQGNLFYCSERVNLDDAVQLATDLYTFQEGQCESAKTGGVNHQAYDISQKVPCGSLCDWLSSGIDGLSNDTLNNGACGTVNGCTPPCTMRSVGCLVSPAKSGVNVPGVGIGQLPPASTWLRIFWKEGGQTVKMETAEAISYIASIVPGTVLTVKAFKQYDGPHVLTTVPTDYYTVSNVTYGSIQAVMITMERELSTYRYDDGTNQGWGNEIYVTFQSSVGPNTVDIMAYLIDTYTDLTWDNDSFNYCWQKLQKFPSNFALLEVKNVIDVLRDIAFQCRCALWISDNVFYMKYLPEEPTLPNFTLAGVSPTDPTTWHNDPNWSAVPANVTAAPGQSVLVNATETSEEVLTGWTKNIFGQEEPVYTNEPSYSVGVSTPQNQVVDVIHVSDIDSETGVEVAYTSTENIVTKMKVTWRMSLAPDNPYPSDAEKHEQQMILRHNLAMYGLHEKTFNWFIYNQPDIILKCATFWMIRYSTTWKTLKFRTFLNKLNLETLDAVLFDDGSRNYATSGPITAVVRKAQYNSADDCIEFELELPVKAGEMDYYPFYWPSKLPVNVTWPPADEIASGAAGGGGIGIWASGNLPTGVINGAISGQTVFVGGPNVVYGPQSDRGDPTPTDVGFQAQSVFPEDSINVNPSGVRPYLTRGIGFLNEEDWIDDPLPTEPLTIDLWQTRITDESNAKTFPGIGGLLGDFFSINPKGGLRLELATAQVVDNRDDQGPLGKSLTTSGTDARIADIFAVGPLPSGVEATDSKQSKMLLIDASDPGVWALTDDPANIQPSQAAEVDFKFDSTGVKVGIATAFLQAASGSGGP